MLGNAHRRSTPEDRPVDRNERSSWALLRVVADEGGAIQVPAGAIAQAWRSGSRQALLSRALRHCDEVVLDGSIGRAAGLLCGRTDISRRHRRDC